MALIEKEYPEGVRSAEMVLVQMLMDKRSWFDYMEITQALWAIRRTAKAMKAERDHLHPCEGVVEDICGTDKPPKKRAAPAHATNQ